MRSNYYFYSTFFLFDFKHNFACTIRISMLKLEIAILLYTHIDFIERFNHMISFSCCYGCTVCMFAFHSFTTNSIIHVFKLIGYIFFYSLFICSSRLVSIPIYISNILLANTIFKFSTIRYVLYININFEPEKKESIQHILVYTCSSFCVKTHIVEKTYIQLNSTDEDVLFSRSVPYMYSSTRFFASYSIHVYYSCSLVYVFLFIDLTFDLT